MEDNASNRRPSLVAVFSGALCMMIMLPMMTLFFAWAAMMPVRYREIPFIPFVGELPFLPFVMVPVVVVTNAVLMLRLLNILVFQASTAMAHRLASVLGFMAASTIPAVIIGGIVDTATDISGAITAIFVFGALLQALITLGVSHVLARP